MENRESVDLDQPAFTSEEVKVVPTAEAPQAESGEGQEQATSGADPVVDEQKVPYSRLKSVIERAREAERRADEAMERLNSLERAPRYEERSERNDEVRPYNGSLPVPWVKMYGDNENSRLAYSYEVERQNELRDVLRREALDAVREERTQESQSLSQNERTIDERIEDLSYSLGRDLSEQEEGALLDIVDEYTPTGRDGKYTGDLLPMDKAWEIYNLRMSQQTNQVARQRRTPTALTSVRTDGEPGSKDASKDWNPHDWNSYRKRIPN